MSIRIFLSHFARFLLVSIMVAAGMGITWYLGHTLVPQESPLMTTFFGLIGLLALVSFLLGYFVRAFYADRSRGIAMNDTLQKIQRSLENSDRSADEHAASKASAIPPDVAEALHYTTDQLHRIQKMIMHLSIAIERLHQAKETAGRQPAAEAEQPPVAAIHSEGGHSAQPTTRTASPDPNTGPGEISAPVTADSRPWRKNLNQILDRIDEGEND